MANQKYQVPSIPAGDAGTGPRFDTDRINDGVNDIHRDKILIAQAGSLNVVAVVNTSPTASDYGLVTRPASHPPNATTTGTITAVSQAVSLLLSGHNTVHVKLSGTWAGTIQFQGSLDGTNWDAITSARLDGSLALNWTANGAFRVPVSGVTQIRATSTAWTSGTATVDIGAGYGSTAVVASNPIPVTDNSSSLTVDAPVGTPVFSRLSDGTAALTTTGSRLAVDASGVAVPVTDNAGSLTVDAPVGTPVFSRLSDGTAALTTTGGRLSVDASGVAVPITDNAASLTVDAPVGTPVYVRLSDGTAALVGQKAMANSLPVTMASDQGALQIQGTSVAQVAGTIVNATSVVGGATDYSAVNNVTITISGTYAGVNAAFEVSDNAGTTWFPIAGQRDDNAVAESTTGVLPANQSRSWVFSLLGYDRMRVRATAWTSGTANVRISTASMPFEPVVSAVTNKPPSAISTTFQFSGAAVTAEALASLTPYRAGVAGGAGTSQAITAGKSFRLQAMTVGYRVGAAAVGGGIAYLRWLAGTVLVGSPILASVGASANAAVSGSGGGTTLTFGDGFDIPPGFSLGVTHIGHATTATITISVLGYEY